MNITSYVDLEKLQYGDILSHFKREENSDGANYLYMYVGLAKHTETEEDLVVYVALYGDKQIYARPVSMFIEKVDKEKYPHIKQEYRFKKSGYKRFVKIDEEFKELKPAEIAQALLNRNKDGYYIVHMRKEDIPEMTDIILVEDDDNTEPVFSAPIMCTCGENKAVHVKHGKLAGIELIGSKTTKRFYREVSKLQYKCHTCGRYISQ
jgi:hypothetical protein